MTFETRINKESIIKINGFRKNTIQQMIPSAMVMIIKRDRVKGSDNI